MGFKFTSSGNFNKIDKFFNKNKSNSHMTILNTCAQEGLKQLELSTPIDSHKTASSWSYKITKINPGYKIDWYNSNVNDGIPIVILLQYGHGTRNGGYVQGHDFINPIMKKIFSDMANKIWKEVTNS